MKPGSEKAQASCGRILHLGEERNIHGNHSAAEPQPKCLNFEEMNHKDTKARRETLDL
uniref:Uncharacterized protein n=1 Tax=Candidatus Kentrum sp. FM TaxID=2126340 RepID=A0A450SYP7_9GAMM|nr:MAG: hypothetical protein BECKFM1743A_GA0114220_102319 [Candidatus Kentron sp. FM]